MQKINVGIIGAGRIGLVHAENILNSPRLKLKAISDVNIDHLIETKFKQIVPTITTNTKQLINDPDIDAIFVCSSTDTHTHYIKEAAKVRKHIFCEKPISFNKEDTRRTLKFVKEAGVKLQVGFNRRFDKHFRKVYDVVKAGTIGKPQLIKICSRDPEIPPAEYIKRSGGLFIDMAIHDFDMIRYISGSEVEEVSVKAATLIDPIFSQYGDIDTAIITLTLENGALAVIDNSRQAVYGYDQRIEVLGDKGHVSINNEKQTNIQILTKNHVGQDHPKYFFLDRYKEAFADEINDFAQAILENKPLKCTGEDGYKAEQIASAAYISWKENRPIFLSEQKHI